MGKKIQLLKVNLKPGHIITPHRKGSLCTPKVCQPSSKVLRLACCPCSGKMAQLALENDRAPLSDPPNALGVRKHSRDWRLETTHYAIFRKQVVVLIFQRPNSACKDTNNPILTSHRATKLKQPLESLQILNILRRLALESLTFLYAACSDGKGD